MLWLILLAACVPIVWTLFLVEDWRRDLTTNQASTDADAEDPLLRPLHSPLSPEALAERVEQFVDSRRYWQLASIERSDDAKTVRLHLVRTTAVLRFKDDIHVTIAETPEGGTVLEATSRSRIGKGDLGQNPRNLRELIGALHSTSTVHAASIDWHPVCNRVGPHPPS